MVSSYTGKEKKSLFSLLVIELSFFFILYFLTSVILGYKKVSKDNYYLGLYLNLCATLRSFPFYFFYFYECKVNITNILWCF